MSTSSAVKASEEKSPGAEEQGRQHSHSHESQARSRAEKMALIKELIDASTPTPNLAKRILDDSSPEVRALIGKAIASGIATEEDKSRALHDENEMVRVRTIEAMIRSGTATDTQILQWQADPSPEVRRKALDALVKRDGAKLKQEYLDTSLKDANAAVRLEVLKHAVLQKSISREAITALLGDRNDKVRALAAGIAIGRGAATEEMVDGMADDSSALVRIAAAKHPEMLSERQRNKMLTDQNQKVAEEMAVSLISSGKISEPQLMSALRLGSRRVIHSAFNKGLLSGKLAEFAISIAVRKGTI